MDERGFRFSKAARLRRRHQFLDLYERGERFHTPHFVLYITENSESGHRFGVTVSRKIGKAAVRNRVKRMLREMFRTRKGLLPDHCDLLVNAKRAATEASSRQLADDFDRVVDRWRRGRQS